jgi:hypothetical protein
MGFKPSKAHGSAGFFILLRKLKEELTKAAD